MSQLLDNRKTYPHRSDMHRTAGCFCRIKIHIRSLDPEDDPHCGYLKLSNVPRDILGPTIRDNKRQYKVRLLWMSFRSHYCYFAHWHICPPNKITSKRPQDELTRLHFKIKGHHAVSLCVASCIPNGGTVYHEDEAIARILKAPSISIQRPQYEFAQWLRSSAVDSLVDIFTISHVPHAKTSKAFCKY